MKIRGEQSALAAEKADLEALLKSKSKLTQLIKNELQGLADAHGDVRRTKIVERAAAQAMSEADLVPSEPVTVILSERGWARAAKGHEVDAETLSYRSGDRFLASAPGRSNQLAVFIDSTGRAYSVSAHALPSARGQGEPLSGHFNPPDGASFRAVLTGSPEDKWVIASSAGYGFVVKLEELYSRNKAGKAVLKVPTGATVVSAAPVVVDAEWVAAASSDGRMLIFPLEELPELPRGKGVKILSLPAKEAVELAAVCAFAEGQSLKIKSGDRVMTLKPDDQNHYLGERGRRGAALPRNWRKVVRVIAE